MSLSAGKKKVLVVEDLEDNRDFIQQVLSGEYDLIFASDGRMGVAMAKAKRPDLIIMDLNLPILDGWEATRILRSDPGLFNTPIIALTAYTLDSDYMRAMEAGCTDFLNKPIMPADLRSKVKEHLAVQ
ncbi:MAG: response regulator [Bacteroidetes bacterium]|nr:response regulator [Bacteroidota bacterium]